RHGLSPDFFQATVGLLEICQQAPAKLRGQRANLSLVLFPVVVRRGSAQDLLDAAASRHLEGVGEEPRDRASERGVAERLEVAIPCLCCKFAARTVRSVQARRRNRWETEEAVHALDRADRIFLELRRR